MPGPVVSSSTIWARNWLWATWGPRY